jgi:hypothetical protein
MTTSYTVRYLVAGGEAVAKFDTSAQAWAFMRDCAARGVVAGFPSLGKWG